MHLVYIMRLRGEALFLIFFSFSKLLSRSLSLACWTKAEQHFVLFFMTNVKQLPLTWYTKTCIHRDWLVKMTGKGFWTFGLLNEPQTLKIDFPFALCHMHQTLDLFSTLRFPNSLHIRQTVWSCKFMIIPLTFSFMAFAPLQYLSFPPSQIWKVMDSALSPEAFCLKRVWIRKQTAKCWRASF